MGNTRQVSLRELYDNRSYLTRRFRSLPGIVRFARNARQDFRGDFGYCFEYSAEKFPHNICLKFEDQQYTYREANEKINRMAHYLKAQGITNGDVVALFMENRPEYLFSLMAINKLGAVASLINNSQFGKVLIHSITLVNPKTAIVGEELLETFHEVKDDCGIPDQCYYVADSSTKSPAKKILNEYVNLEEASRDSRASNVMPARRIAGDDPALYIYTSGTTGLPKATIQKHKKIFSIYGQLSMFVNQLRESDVVYCTLPLYHATGLLVCWPAALANGSTFVIKRKFSASEFWSDVDRYRVTAFGYVGELCRYLMNQPESELDRKNRVRVIMGNGLKSELWKPFKNRFGIDEIRELYASSEGNIGSFNLLNIDETVGFLAGQTAIVKFDNETEQPLRDSKGRMMKVKKGEPGLLIGKITKLTPFEGYTQPEKNRDKIFHNVFKEGDTWFNTGDLIREVGFRHIQFMDRTGDTYRWKGENVSTSEVESIANQFPGIEESIAYGVEVPKTNGRAGMIAITLEGKKRTINGEEFYQFLCSNLPPYAVPLFVRIQKKVEQTGTFKYQRTQLQKQGFNLEEVDEPLMVALPGEGKYRKLTEKILEKINDAGYRF